MRLYLLKGKNNNMPENSNFDFYNITQEVSGEEIPPETPPQAEENSSSDNSQFNNGYNQNINHTYVTYIPYGLTPETYEERKSIKKSATVVGLSFLSSHLIILIVGFIIALGVQFLSFSIPQIENLLTEPIFLHTQQILLSMFMFTVPFILIFKIAGYRISSLLEFKKPEKGLFLPFFLFGIGFCSFSNIAMGYASTFFEGIGIEYNVDFGENPKGVFGFLIALISTVIVPALVEEFACRGLVLGALRKYGDGFAVMVSAILFGAMHGNFEQIPFAFLVGLVLGFVTVQSGSIRIAILIHAFNNFISLFFDYFLKDISIQLQNTIYALFLCVSMVLAIFSIFLLKNKSEVFKFKEPKEKIHSEDKQLYKWFFTSAFIIIFLVVCFIDSCSFFFV